MRDTSMGQVLFAVAILALGGLSLGSGDFAFVWQPVPAALPGRVELAYLSGTVLCVCGVGLLVRPTVALASFVLTLYTLVWLLALHVPQIIAAPLQEMNWGGAGEIATLLAASWILYASHTAPWRRFYVMHLTGDHAIGYARIVFALGVPLVGLEHMLYSTATASMVPAWLPYRTGWAYATGAAHIAAGLAILFAVLPRLAAALETLMMGIFTVLVWIPAVMAVPTQRFGWTALLISTVITAAGWIVTESYRGLPWLAWSRRRTVAADLAVH
ncbi:DoxX family protein [Dyella acidiphila]|uniref:DoxX family protein n=1 Tax=Dyella acidiphila TaxID=2775866 RepID=A0ABR9GDP9_9GAMM|nr:DoxX family protein [Dyella acidiphila]MBE1162180.1 DoxX family protein [Dyella acidiphila]